MSEIDDSFTRLLDCLDVVDAAADAFAAAILEVEGLSPLARLVASQADVGARAIAVAVSDAYALLAIVTPVEDEEGP